MNKINILSGTIILSSLFGVACNTGVQQQPLYKEPTRYEAIKLDTDELDVLTDYDRSLWTGPDGWSKEQWQWKRTLRWSKECDYIGEIDVYPISNNRQLVAVTCVPGAYQMIYRLFIFNLADKSSIPLNLGDHDNTDNPREVSGHIKFDDNNKQLSILTLSRGTGDCGVYRIYDFTKFQLVPKLIEKRKRDCIKNSIPEPPPRNFFDPKKWPLVYPADVERNAE